MRSYKRKRKDFYFPVHGGLCTAELDALGLKKESLLDFSVNINPLGTPPSVRQAIEQVDVSSYPDRDCLELRSTISVRSGVPVEQIVIGNGTTELIHLLVNQFLSPEDTVVIVGPTFNEYAAAVSRRSTDITYLDAEEKDGFKPNFGEVIEQLSKYDPKQVFLCNPNNPTGVYADKREIDSIIRALGPDGILILDEAYISFLDDPWDSRELLKDGNVVILHSMTKEYAIAGLRLGYALCPVNMAETLRSHQVTWSVNALAQAAGLAALQDDKYLMKGRQIVAEGKDLLVEGLSGLGYEVFPGEADFILVKVGDAAHFRAKMLKKGICVRDCSSFGLPEFIRIGIRSLPECKQLLVEFKQDKKTPSRYTIQDRHETLHLNATSSMAL